MLHDERARALANPPPRQIDRKNVYREQSRALFFPHFEKPRGKPEDRIVQEIGSRWKALHETVLDGELVWDTLKDGRVSTLALLEMAPLTAEDLFSENSDCSSSMRWLLTARTWRRARSRSATG